MHVSLARLWNGFVTSSSLVSGTVGEQKVDDSTDDREQEDEKTPKYFVRNLSIGLQDLNCAVM